MYYMRLFFVVVVILFIFSSVDEAYAEASPSSGVEVFVAGQKFISVIEYEQKKKKDENLLIKERALENKVKNLSDSPAIEDVITSIEPFMGKTVELRPDGTLITSQATIEEGKTVEISPAGRVAGVQPSFQQVAEDFDQGKGRNGIDLQKVTSAEHLEKELHQKLKDIGSPVLLISDRKKVRLMELAPVQENPP